MPDKDKKISRRQLRLAAAQFLYGWAIKKNNIEDLSTQLEIFWENFEGPTSGREFAESLITGALQNEAKINTILKERIQNYDLSRVHKVDLSVLQIAIYELLFRIDIPPVVTINEAVEIAKDLSNDESGKFINGILDKIAATLDRPLREPGA